MYRVTLVCSAISSLGTRRRQCALGETRREGRALGKGGRGEYNTGMGKGWGSDPLNKTVHTPHTHTSPPQTLVSASLRQEVWINRVERSKIFAQRDARRRCGHMSGETTALITPIPRALSHAGGALLTLPTPLAAPFPCACRLSPCVVPEEGDERKLCEIIHGNGKGTVLELKGYYIRNRGIYMRI